MERKNFMCYACNKSNNFYVKSDKLGNCCKYCGTFNYFKIKRIKSNLSISNRQEPQQIEQNEINPQHSSISNNIFPNILNENSPLLSNNNHHNNNLNSSIDYPYFIREINQSFIYDYELNELENEALVNNYSNKYEWLTKTIATKDIIDKYGKDPICSICYEKFKVKDNIHITKCEHIFHYFCIEKAVDNNIYDCPLCRTNIQTGEKKHINEVRNYFNDIENNNEYILVNNNMYFLENNNNNNNLLMNEFIHPNYHSNCCFSFKKVFFCFLNILKMLVLGIIFISKKIKNLIFIILNSILEIFLHSINFPFKIAFIILFFFILLSILLIITKIL